MEDGHYLGPEDKNLWLALKDELARLQAEHKEFSSTKGGVSPENKEKWKLNSKRVTEINLELKKLKFKNVFGVAKP